nr:probable sucrose-phosphate synthase 4 isoform X1 [Ipomoea trifida]
MQIMRFFTNPHKPMILALSRPDPKKNVTTLLKAFGECQALQELANMTLILGNRDDIEEMSSNSSTVLTTVLKLIDKYNLYGQVAYPKHHKQHEVPDIYRLAAKTKGVFINPALVEPFGLTLIEAAAYGLPVVATKNGGPVDIIKALNNGLLVDPHDQQGISDALLKLVGDKNRWLECRKNGLKNIHRFSWPEHCRNYLSHVEHCRNRHPANRLEVITPTDEPMSESLCGVEDLSLKFSMDAEFKPNGELDLANRQQELINILTPKATSNSKSNIGYFPGRRQGLYVVAADCYNNTGNATEILSLIIKNVKQITGLKSSQTGLVLLTGMSLQETKEAVKNSQVNLEDFDALVCNSGSEIYYPWRDLIVDEDYEAHIEYRWPGENVKSAVTRLAKVDGGTESNDMKCMNPSSSRCYSYSINAGTKTRKVNDIRQRLRMRGFRCNILYTNAGLRLNVIPLCASRAQAIRYLSIKWGIDLSRITVLVGENGDTDYEDLLVGLHKTVILQGCVEYGSDMLLQNEDSFKWQDVVPQDSTTTAIAESYEAHNISTALEKLGSM